MAAGPVFTRKRRLHPWGENYHGSCILATLTEVLFRLRP